jgi:hypothetical protein
MNATMSGMCFVFIYNLQQSCQTGIVVLEALAITQVTPNVFFQGKQFLSLKTKLLMTL